MLRTVVIAAALLGPALAHAEFKKPTPAPKAEPLTISGMLDKINSVYMQGMQRCYVKGLAKNPGLSGKVTVMFTINPFGHVSGSANGIAPAVDSCLSSQVGGWRFPTPRNPKGVPTEASFKINLLLHQ